MSKLWFNLNNMIYVRLSASGWKTLKEYLINNYGNDLGGSLFDNHRSKMDSLGFAEFQAWEFMQMFGSKISLAKSDLFGMNIKINSENLRESEGLT